MQTTTETKQKKTKGKVTKTTKAVVVAKAATSKAVVVVPTVTVADRKEAEKRISAARECLLQMHKSWFLFGKHLKTIRDERDEQKLKVESFKKLCEREFPTVDITHIYKMILVIEKMGPEIERRMKNPTYLVPSPDACYCLTTLKRVHPDGTVDMRVPEVEYKKLEKELLDSGIGSPSKSERVGFVAFRTRIKEILNEAKKKMRAEVNAETEKWAEEEQMKLSKELAESGIHDDDDEAMLDDDDFEHSVDEVEFEDVDTDVQEDTVDTARSLINLAARVDYLIDHIPPFVESLTAIDGKTRDLLKKIKKLQTILTETTEALSGN